MYQKPTRYMRILNIYVKRVRRFAHEGLPTDLKSPSGRLGCVDVFSTLGRLDEWKRNLMPPLSSPRSVCVCDPSASPGRCSTRLARRPRDPCTSAATPPPPRVSRWERIRRTMYRCLMCVCVWVMSCVENVVVCPAPRPCRRPFHSIYAPAASC